MIDFFYTAGFMLAILCLFYCSWYFIRQGGAKNTIVGILVFFIVGIIPAGPIIFAVYLFTKKKTNDQAADVGEPKVYHG